MAHSVVEYRVMRFGLGGRLHHWVHAAGMSLFIFTGMQIYLREEFLLERSLIRDLHIGIGIFIGVWDVVYYGGFILLYDRHIKDLIPTPQDIKDMFIVLGCALGYCSDDEYPDYNLYDTEREVYYRKFHPGQKLLYSADILAILFMGITGFGLLAESEVGFLGFLVVFNDFIEPFMGLLGYKGTEAIRVAHFLGFVYFSATTAIHAYMAVLPQNYNALRGMLLGTESLKEEIDR
ncbi:MAG: cytochrome b/b6 domain-containing protein [Candidatus Hodarchaeota archaeon]